MTHHNHTGGWIRRVVPTLWLLLLFAAELLPAVLAQAKTYVKTPRAEWDPAPAGRDAELWHRCQAELDVDGIRSSHPRPVDCLVEGEQVSCRRVRKCIIRQAVFHLSPIP
jgi:hypothetical protein